MGDRWRAIAALADRSRRALYLYVRRQDHPVSREEAARAERVSRKLAAFHLDKLVDAGLLRARFEPPAGRVRGRGRTPKVYEPAGDDLVLTVPERRYQLLAEILADTAAGAPDLAAGAHHHARQRGLTLGAELRQAGGADRDPVPALASLGFEPQPAPDGRVVLGNCPFHALASRHTELVCGMNHAFVTGLLTGLAADQMEARLAPKPPACCVELAPRTDPAAGRSEPPPEAGA